MEKTPMNPVLRETPRTLLRDLCADDLALVTQIVSENQRFLALVEMPMPPAEVAADIVTIETLPPGGKRDNASHQLLTTRADGEPLGVLCTYRGYPGPHSLYIGELLLRPSFHRMGYGRELLVALEAHALATQIHELLLAVNAGNWSGMRFWVAMGYREITKLVGDPDVDGNFAARIELRKDLTRSS